MTTRNAQSTERTLYFEAVWNDPRPETDHKEYRVRLDGDPYSAQRLRAAARRLWDTLPNETPFGPEHVAETMWIDQEYHATSTGDYDEPHL